MKEDSPIQRVLKRLVNLKTKLGRTEKDLTAAHVLQINKDKTWPSWQQWGELPNVLSKGERKISLIALAVFALSVVFVASWFVVTHRVEMASVGGEYTEGLIGEPQFVNPLYASASDVDSDLTELVFSGLFRYDPVSGLVPDLASSFEISEDQTTYTITIRDDARWHDGEPVRASDVIFTIQSIQNPEYKSPLAVSFQGVSVAEMGEKQVQFTLLEPFAPFLSSLTVGIIPSHLWEQIAPIRATLTDLNLTPIGSGPYKFSKYTKDKMGNIGTYVLERNPDYYAQPASIEQLAFKFYSDAHTAVDALTNRNIEGLAFIPADLVSEVEKIRGVEIMRPSIPQITAIFFNQEKNDLLAEHDVRQALIQSINKEEIINEVLGGHASAIDAPILPGMVGYHEDIERFGYDPDAARILFDEHREESEEVAFTLTVLDQAEFIHAAEIIQRQWAEIGVTLEIRVVAALDLQALVLSGRNYEMFLTGELLGTDPDPYPFWHSSQASDPGLNLAGYENRKADELLEEARITTDPEERAAKYIEFQDFLAEDLPAIFLYQPTYRYAVASKIKNIDLERITDPSDRFSRINEWYIKMKMKLRWSTEEPMVEEVEVVEPAAEEPTAEEVVGPTIEETIEEEPLDNSEEE